MRVRKGWIPEKIRKNLEVDRLALSYFLSFLSANKDLINENRATTKRNIFSVFIPIASIHLSI